MRQGAVLQVWPFAWGAGVKLKTGHAFRRLLQVVCGLVLGTAQADGQSGQLEGTDGPIHVQLQTEDRAMCTAERSLGERISERSERIVFSSRATASVAARLFRPSPVQPYVASLTIEQVGREEYQREIRADSCAELLDAIAVVVVVRLDPPAPVGTSSPVSPDPPPVPPSVAPSTTLDAFERGRESSSQVHVSLGAAAALAFGPAPEVLPGAAVTVGVGAVPDQPVMGFNPALRLSALYFGRAGMAAEWGRATIVLAALRLELCPLSYHASEVAWLLCAFGDAGELQARGRATYEPAELSRLWAVAGGSTVFSYWPHPSVSLNAAVSLGRTLTPYVYQFEDETLHATSPSTAGASLGLGFAWE